MKWLSHKEARKERNGQPAIPSNTIQNAWDLLGFLQWNGKMSYCNSITSTSQLSYFLGTFWLSNDHINMMVEEMLLEMHTTRPDDLKYVWVASLTFAQTFYPLTFYCKADSFQSNVFPTVHSLTSSLSSAEISNDKVDKYWNPFSPSWSFCVGWTWFAILFFVFVFYYYFALVITSLMFYFSNVLSFFASSFGCSSITFSCYAIIYLFFYFSFSLTGFTIGSHRCSTVSDDYTDHDCNHITAINLLFLFRRVTACDRWSLST